MDNNKKQAYLLILFFGFISALGDIIYEGARSVNGPYLKTLGANAVIVGFVIGIGEFLGYVIRLVSGYFSDKTKAYWVFTIVGYSMLISVPLLALSDAWQIAAVFIVLERIGKGLRSPAKDTIVSHAAKQVGTGFGFGIAEFFDQFGATLGPLIFAVFFFYLGTSSKNVADYQQGYSLMWIPFVLLLLVLFITYFKFPTPSRLEEERNDVQSTKLSKDFWIYSFFTFITTVGFIHFAIVSYHLKVNGFVSDTQIPFLYAIAMIIDAFFAIIIGKIYDKLKVRFNNEHAGLLALILIPILSGILLPMMFSNQLALIYLAVVFWGIVMGSHETIMKAAIADLTSIKKRGTGYGIFNVIYGLAIFVGSTLAGYFYEISISMMIVVFICFEIIALIVFSFLRLSVRKPKI